MVSPNAVGGASKVWGEICPICNWWGHADHQLRKIEIVRYKSLRNISMELKRINVLIGEPGVGKSEILETFALWQCFLARQALADDLVLKIKRWSELNGTRVVYRDDDASAELTISSAGKYYVAEYKKEPVALLEEPLHISWINAKDELERPRLAYYKFGEPTIELANLNYLVPPFGYNISYILRRNKRLRNIAKNYGYAGVYESLPEPVKRYLQYLAISETNKHASIAIDDMTCLYPPLTKIAAEHIARDTDNQYLISTYDEIVLLSLIEKAPADEINVYVVKKDFIWRADPEKILDLATDIFFNLDLIVGGGA